MYRSPGRVAGGGRVWPCSRWSVEAYGRGPSWTMEQWYTHYIDYTYIIIHYIYTYTFIFIFFIHILSIVLFPFLEAAIPVSWCFKICGHHLSPFFWGFTWKDGDTVQKYLGKPRFCGFFTIVVMKTSKQKGNEPWKIVVNHQVTDRRNEYKVCYSNRTSSQKKHVCCKGSKVGQAMFFLFSSNHSSFLFVSFSLNIGFLWRHTNIFYK